MLPLYLNIKKHRLQAKMSQAELARLTGYTDRSSIAKIESGAVDLSQSKIEQFAAVFGISPQELMGWGDETGEPAEYDGLSEKKKALIEFALSVPEDKASMVLRILKSIVEDD